MRPKNIRGEKWPYRDEPGMLVVRDHVLFQCSECAEGALDEAETEALETVLAESYAALRTERQKQLIQTLTGDFDLRQGDIEHLLGVSAGYLSKAQHQGKVLSPATYRLLFLLSRNPYEVAHELAKLDKGLEPLVEHLDRVRHHAFIV